MYTCSYHDNVSILAVDTGVMVYHLDKPMVHRYIISHLDTAIVYLMQQAATKHTTVSDHTLM